MTPSKINLETQIRHIVIKQSKVKEHLESSKKEVTYQYEE